MDLIALAQVSVRNISKRDYKMAKTPKTKLKTPTDLKTNQAATVADALNGILPIPTRFISRPRISIGMLPVRISAIIT